MSLKRKKISILIIIAILFGGLVYSVFYPRFTESTKVDTLIVKGMSCESCSTKIKNNLEKQKFINKVLITHTNEIVKVEYNNSKKSIKDISKIISDLGYTTQSTQIKKTGSKGNLKVIDYKLSY